MPAKKAATPPAPKKKAAASTQDANSLLPVVHQTLKASRAERDAVRTKLEESVEILRNVQVHDSRVTTVINTLTELIEGSNVGGGTEDAAITSVDEFLTGTTSDPADIDPAD